MYDRHDAPTGGNRRRKETYPTVSGDFYLPRQSQFVHKYILSCESFRRVKSSSYYRAQMKPIPIPEECSQSCSMDFVFTFPDEDHKHDAINVLISSSRYYICAVVPTSIIAQGCSRVFIDTLSRLH